MKSPRLSRAVSIVIAVALLSIALSVTPAGASTTTWLTSQVKAIWTKLNPLIVKVNGINTKVASHTTQISTLKSRVDTLSGTGFWPVQDLAVELSLTPRLLGGGGWIMQVDLLAKPVGAQALVPNDTPAECVVKYSWAGQTYTLYGPTFALTNANSGLVGRPDSGSPITVEYWVERYGVKKHGTIVNTYWSWP